MTPNGKPCRRTVTLGLGAWLGGLGAPVALAAQENQPPPEGGIGGTGIVGLLTSVAPFQVNGVSLSLSQGTVFRDYRGPIETGEFRPGDPVTVVANRRDPEHARALRIDRVTPLIGILRFRDSTMSVNGVSIRVEPGSAPPPQVGSRVAVQGVWDGASVIASRVEPALSDAPDVIAGTVRFGRRGVRIANVPIDRPAWRLAVPEFGFVTAIGTYSEATGLRVQRLLPRRFRPNAAQSLQALLVEGYLELADQSPGYRISGLGHSFDAAARLGPAVGRRVLFEGAYRGDFRVASGLILPERMSERSELLARATEAERVRLR